MIQIKKNPPLVVFALTIVAQTLILTHLFNAYTVFNVGISLENGEMSIYIMLDIQKFYLYLLKGYFEGLRQSKYVVFFILKWKVSVDPFISHNNNKLDDASSTLSSS